MMRKSWGANDHLDSILFIQMYRLISTYSLVKPSKWSNVSNVEIFDEHWEGQLNTILNRDCADVFIEVTTMEKEHNYNFLEISKYANSHISGYVCRQAEVQLVKFMVDKKQITCNNCVSTL